MIDVIVTLFPVLGALVLGRVLIGIEFPSRRFWGEIDKLVYWLFFPALLLRATAGAKFDGDESLLIAVGVLTPILIVIVSLTLLARALRMDRRRRAVVIQSSVRQNAYVGAAASVALWGEPALQPVALALAFYVPVLNAYSAWLLGRSDGGIWRYAILNPLVLAALAGSLISLTGIVLPPVVDGFLDMLGQASLPLALLAVGAAIKLEGNMDGGRWILVATSIKLLVVPLLTVVTVTLLGLPPMAAGVLLVFAAVPTAPSGYVQTQAMGGDGLFMARAISLQTVCAFVTLPLILWLFTGGHPG